jgi:serine/threonine protein kinase
MRTAGTTQSRTRSVEAQFELHETLVGLGLSTVGESEPMLVGHGGRYALRKLLGRGGMGTVYLADDRELPREVAIKVVKRASQNRDELERRLRREAMALARLDHPNVLRIHDVDTTDGGELFIVMQYIRGQTLREWSEACRPSLSELLEVFVYAGRGLQAAHDDGQIHRDFKPDNVMLDTVDGQPRVVVADFGLAGGPSLHAHDAAVLDDAERVHSTLAVLGTRAYMAPEQLRREPASAASDQYSFCVSLWELVAGKPPEFGVGHLPQRPRRMPRWLYRALRRGLAEDPTQRFPELRSLIETLERAPRRRVIARRLGLIAALGAALGLGAVLLGSSQSKPPNANACTDAGAAIDEVWSVNARYRVESRLRTLALGDAVFVDHALGLLDEATERWRSAERQQCEQPWLGRPPRDQACSDLWLSRFERHVELLATLDVSALIHVPELLESLSNSSCVELPTPLDGEVAELLELARDQELLGNYDAAQSYAERALQLSAGIDSCGRGFAYEQAESKFRLGHIHAKWSHPEQAQVWLHGASAQAHACRYPELERRAHLRAVKVSALQSQDLTLARQQLEYANAAANLVNHDNLGDDFEELVARAAIAYLEQDYDQARRYYENALKLIAGHDPVREAEARINIGAMAISVGDTNQAEASYKSAKTHLERELGPSYAREKLATIAVNQGMPRFERGEYEAARHDFEQAITSAQYKTALTGFNGLLSIEIRQADRAETYDHALELVDRFERRFAGIEDLPPAELALARFMTGRVRLQASQVEEFATKSADVQTKIIERGFADMQTSLALLRELPDASLRHSCMVLLAWYRHEIDADDSRAGQLLDEAMPQMRETDQHYATGALLYTILADSR